MDARILQKLSAITREEKALLAGETAIDRSLYMDGSRDMITGKKLLEPGQLMTLRPHTRFVDFPEHTHDYVEMVYMCQGQTTHVINGQELLLREGELLMLGPNATQAIRPAGETDIGINLIIRPEFFSGTLDFLGSEETPLRDFILRCLCGEGPSGYLHFQVAEVKPVQNLMENLLFTLVEEAPNRRSLHRLTMGLLFVQLLNHTDKLTIGSKEQQLIVQVLSYIEEHYAAGSLGELAQHLHYNEAWLSRQIKRRTGKTYTDWVQEKRLAQAGWLLKHTAKRVEDVARAVGYENVSYFHRLFQKRYGVSPFTLRKGG